MALIRQCDRCKSLIHHSRHATKLIVQCAGNAVGDKIPEGLRYNPAIDAVGGEYDICPSCSEAVLSFVLGLKQQEMSK
jgi:hypothetical protein